MQKNEELKQEALKYWNLGCAVVPFNPKDKKPLIEWQKWQKTKQTEQDFNNIHFDFLDGFALICGTELKNGMYLGVLDFDVKNLPEEIVEKGKKLLSKFRVTQTEQTPSGGQHLIYFCHEKPKTISAYHNEVGLELIGEGKLVVMAPSTNYRRLNDNIPTEIESLQLMFEEVLTREGLRIKKKQFWFDREDLSETKYKGEIPPCLAELSRGADEGLRNEYAIRLAGYYLNFRKNSPKFAKKYLKEWNRDCNIPPLDDKELDSIFTSALRGGYVYGCNDPILWKNCDRTKCHIGTKAKPKLNDEEKSKAETLLLDADFLNKVLQFGRKRLLGEDNIILTNFIVFCSGQTKYPISSIIEGFSGSGKNESIRAIKPFLPDEWLFEFTTSTPEAIKYIGEDFAGTIIIYEASGMESKTGTLGLRAIGEGESIETIYPLRDETTGKMMLGRAKTNAKNFVTTESDVDVHPDLYRRVLKNSMNHSIALTKRVLAKKLRDAMYPNSLKNMITSQNEAMINEDDFKNALRIIEWDREVILYPPYKLMNLLDVAVTIEQKVAMRTHLEKILNFIKILALINQKRRIRIQIGNNKYVIANPEDVRLGIKILEPIILSTIARLGRRQKEVLDLFGDNEAKNLNKHEVASKLDISEQTAYKVLKSLYKNGFVNEDRSQKEFQYRLLNKPIQVSLLERESKYYLFYKDNVEKLLRRISSSLPPVTGAKSIIIEGRIEEATFPLIGREDEITHPPGRGEEDEVDLASNQVATANSGNFTSPLPKRRDESEDKSIISLVRLTSHFEDKCFKCGISGTMDYQANFTDGSWGLLCEKCGKEMEEKMRCI